MVRIYDAAFADTSGNEHWHLATFWWLDAAGNRGTWSRKAAYDFVRTHTEGTVYVSEAGRTVTVCAYYNKNGTEWIQTVADGVRRDNLTTLAIRHRQGQPNL